MKHFIPGESNDKYGILKNTFGYNSFRGCQEEIIDTLLTDRDALAVMPTGAGKSLCYQIPALLSGGVTLVVSPLISLMKDQVEMLISAEIPAAYINTTLTAPQLDKVLKKAENGSYKLIYVAPERLLTQRFLQLCERLDIAMVAVDEAHCVSQWGHDFRSAYLDINTFVRGLKQRPRFAAFTATATDEVRKDIVRLLGLENPKIFVSGFDRPNLRFEVRRPKGKFSALLNLVREHSGESGIIYCATRKNVEEVTHRLNAMGCDATRYHAGLSDRERKRNQEDFLCDRVPVIVATNAFGMGIDKSNVSFVIHYNMPKDLESYYQEAGRAGRDGSPADCVLLYEKKDIVINRFLINKAHEDSSLTEEQRQTAKKNSINRLNQMVDYCEKDVCLRKAILTYFGENAPSKCGNCSVCNPRPENEESALTESEAKQKKKEHNAEKKDANSLFERLRARRKEIAAAEGLPAFVIFTDATLRDMSKKKPQTKAEFLDVSGIGKAKQEKYAGLFLPVLLGEEPPAVSAVTKENPALEKKTESCPLPPAFVLMKELREGAGIEETAAKYGTTPNKIWSALVEAGFIVLE